MNEDIIRMAREAGMKLAWVAPIPGANKMKVLLDVDQVERFAELVAAAEREACAKVCDDMEEKAEGTECCKWPTPADCAYAIRARGNT